MGQEPRGAFMVRLSDEERAIVTAAAVATNGELRPSTWARSVLVAEARRLLDERGLPVPGEAPAPAARRRRRRG